VSSDAFKRLARARARQRVRTDIGPTLIIHIVHSASPRRAVRTTPTGKIEEVLIPADNEPADVRAAEIERRLQALGIRYRTHLDSDGIPLTFDYVVGLSEGQGPDTPMQLRFACGLEPITRTGERKGLPIDTSAKTRESVTERENV
jgi:hypothetical protein